MRRRDFLASCWAGAAFSAFACARRRMAARQKIRLIANRLLSMSSLYLAQESNYFLDAGLDVEFQQVSGPLESMALLAGGKADAVFAGLTSSYLNAVLKGLPVRIVAGREIASPGCGRMGVVYGLRRKFPRGLDDLTQLKGKRIAAGPAIGLSQFALDAQLERAGLSGDDVTTVNLPSAQSVAALLGGSLDALVLNMEFDRSLTSMSKEIVHSAGLAPIYPNFQHSFIFFGSTLINADPDLGARFLSAYLRGAREFVQGKTPRFMEEFARSNNLDIKQVTSACRDTFTLDGTVDLKSLQLFIDWTLRKKYITTPMDAASLVDLRFLRRAHGK